MLESLNPISTVTVEDTYAIEPSSALDAKVDEVGRGAICRDEADASNQWSKVFEDVKGAFSKEKENLESRMDAVSDEIQSIISEKRDVVEQRSKDVEAQMSEELRAAEEEFDAECQQAYTEALDECKNIGESLSTEGDEVLEHAIAALDKGLERAEAKYNATLDAVTDSLDAAKVEAEE